MRIAIIGGGISGLSAAFGLQDKADVVLYESRQRLGGHADTHNLLIDGQAYAVDTGFTAFNRDNYPGFTNFLETLGVRTQPVQMTLGVSGGKHEFEYGTADLAALFSHRRNMANPRFLAMLADVVRFHRATRQFALSHSAQIATRFGPAEPAPDVSTDLTLDEFLAGESYGAAFVEEHLLPMCVALWSLPANKVRRMPFAHVAAFLTNNQMLRFWEVPGWEVVSGGSNNYISAFVSQFRGELRLGRRVTHVDRDTDSVRVETSTTAEIFDHVVFACDAAQALRLIDATASEKEILGAVKYCTNRAVVHSDESFMPQRRSAWSSWNVVGDTSEEARVTRWVNALQSMPREQQFFVSLNPDREPHRIWAERHYQLPIFTAQVSAAQRRRNEISGHNRSVFCGAYWGGGSHEDGFVSGRDIATALSLAREQAA